MAFRRSDMLILSFVLFTLCPNCSARNLLADSSSESDNATCSIDFYAYLSTLSISFSVCEQGSSTNYTSCCRALLNTFGIGLALHLRNTNIFELQDNATAYACLHSYQKSLDSIGSKVNFLNQCFPVPYKVANLISDPLHCAGIINTTDWDRVVGNASMDQSCKGDLRVQSDCNYCTSQASIVAADLSNLWSNDSNPECVYFAVLYGSGIINSKGPTDKYTAQCLLAVNFKDETSHNRQFYIIISVCSVATVAVLGLLLYLGRKMYRLLEQKIVYQHRRIKLEGPNTGVIEFHIEELKEATNGFSPQNILGEGASGTVFKGQIDGLEVAIKSMKSGVQEDDQVFVNEVQVISQIKHRNLLQVRGYCIATVGNELRHRLLVLEFLSGGNLEQALHSNLKPILSWPERRKIAIAIATGINYLHNEAQPTITHRDIKPSNVLLDANLNAKVADFGLARVTPQGISHLTTRIAGTPIYMAPEYALYGHLSDKIDVYSYGIMLLELLSGRKAMDTSRDNPEEFHIADWAWSLVKEGNSHCVVDERIRQTGLKSVMETFVHVGILCAHTQVCYRPSIANVLRMLEGDMELPELPIRPRPYTAKASFHTQS